MKLEHRIRPEEPRAETVLIGGVLLMPVNLFLLWQAVSQSGQYTRLQTSRP
jgi:hypothetical protein